MGARTVSAENGIEFLTPDLLQSDKLRRLHGFWAALKGSRGLPFRADFHPEQLGFILGQITVIEVLRDPLNFRYKLIGTRIEAAGRRGDQGKTVDRIEPAPYRDLADAAYRQVTKDRAPCCQRISYVSYVREEDVISFERIILPFTQSGDEVDVLLEAMDWWPGFQQDFSNFSLPAAD